MKRGLLLASLVACGGDRAATTVAQPQPSATATASVAAIAPAVDASAAVGALPPDVIQRTVRAAFSHFKICYVTALKKNKSLAGRVETKFVIDETGHVISAEDVTRSNVLQDDDARSCIVEKFKHIEFPPPSPSGQVPVTYPLMFEPAMAADEATTDAGAPPSGDTGDEYGHRRAPFDPAAAAAALAKVDVKSCSSPTGFHGAGHVKVTFDPSGVPTKAQIDSAMPNAATSACVTKAFMAARIAVFSGSAVTVGKSFAVP